jgi:hopanoid-associated phosphorylase
MTLLVTVNEAGEDQTAAPDAKAVIAVVGLAIEARIAGTAAMIADGDRTASLLRDAMRQGVRGIISFGVCGGLDPRLRPGKVIIASSVFAGKDKAYPSDLLWAAQLLRMMPNAGYSPIAGVASPMTSFEERRAFHATTGAVAVDMESQIVARIAVEFRIPFAACRVVLNPAHRILPRAALINIGPAGKPALRKIGGSVLREPRQLPGLSRLAVDALIAMRALHSAKQRLGTHLGFLPSRRPVAIPTRAPESITRAPPA